VKILATSATIGKTLHQYTCDSANGGAMCQSDEKMNQTTLGGGMKNRTATGVYPSIIGQKFDGCGTNSSAVRWPVGAKDV
jgi:hypothetical protein